MAWTRGDCKIDAIRRWLFVWANTVVNFVNEKGGNPAERLEAVLENMAKVPDDDMDYIGRLYAQILFASSARKRPKERSSLSLVLASLVWLKVDLPKKVLLELLAPNGLPSRSLSSVNAAIDSLKSVVVSEGDDEILRVCHKSFLDFLEDEDRVQASIKSLPVTSGVDPESILATFSRSQQN